MAKVTKATHKKGPKVRYDVYESCIHKVRRGFEAIKHNYSNTKCKRIWIKVSPCGTKLIYQDIPDGVKAEELHL